MWDEAFVYQSIIFKKRLTLDEAIRLVRRAKDTEFPLFERSYENRHDFDRRRYERSACDELERIFEQTKETKPNANPIEILAEQQLIHLDHVNRDRVRNCGLPKDPYSACMYKAYEKVYSLFPEDFDNWKE